MKTRIAPWISDEILDKLFNEYDYNSIKEFDNNSSWYKIPKELTTHEYCISDSNWSSYTDTGYVSTRSRRGSEYYIKLFTDLTSQEYFDILVLHIKYIEDRPKCKQCGSPLQFHSIYSGYTLEKISWEDKLDRCNGGCFCSNQCQSTYQHEHPNEYPECYKQGTGHSIIVKSIKFNKEFRLRSRLESWAVEWAEGDDQVYDLEYESISIPYYDPERDTLRNYIPDFKITYIDKSISIVECKRYDHIKLPNNIVKFQAATQYCIDHNWKFEVWTEWDF